MRRLRALLLEARDLLAHRRRLRGGCAAFAARLLRELLAEELLADRKPLLRKLRLVALGRKKQIFPVVAVGPEVVVSAVLLQARELEARTRVGGVCAQHLLEPLGRGFDASGRVVLHRLLVCLVRALRLELADRARIARCKARKRENGKKTIPCRHLRPPRLLRLHLLRRHRQDRRLPLPSPRLRRDPRRRHRHRRRTRPACRR